MRVRFLAALALSATVAVPAAFAQTDNPRPPAPQPAGASGLSGQVELRGTIVTLTADRIEVKVDSVMAPQGATVGSAIGVGKTAAFTLDLTTEIPQGLKAGDAVDLWFTGTGGGLHATRVAPATESNQSAATTSAASTSRKPAAGASSPAGEKARSVAESAGSAAPQEKLPGTASPLPLIGVLGLAALASALLLRFVFRV
jgi:hypothetical protein